MTDRRVLHRQPGLLREEDLEQESPHQRLGGETDPALEDGPLRRLRQETVQGLVNKNSLVNHPPMMS